VRPQAGEQRALAFPLLSADRSRLVERGANWNCRSSLTLARKLVEEGELREESEEVRDDFGFGNRIEARPKADTHVSVVVLGEARNVQIGQAGDGPLNRE